MSIHEPYCCILSKTDINAILPIPEPPKSINLHDLAPNLIHKFAMVLKLSIIFSGLLTINVWLLTNIFSSFDVNVNLKVDVNHAYTSALKRASKTLEIVLYVLKKNIPIISDKALNERNYGSLTGMNKDDARNKWGDEQVKLWRRSYDIAPENGESLKDTCNRTIPYFKKNILPKLHDGENVIITAHGNSLRSIIMHVEGLSEEAIVNVEITTGIPIVYEYENKKVIKKTELFVKRY